MNIPLYDAKQVYESSKVSSDAEYKELLFHIRIKMKNVKILLFNVI